MTTVVEEKTIDTKVIAAPQVKITMGARLNTYKEGRLISTEFQLGTSPRGYAAEARWLDEEAKNLVSVQEMRNSSIPYEVRVEYTDGTVVYVRAEKARD